VRAPLPTPVRAGKEREILRTQGLLAAKHLADVADTTAPVETKLTA
jgi:hypothetical protein